MKNGFRNSDGWSSDTPKFSQRVAPFFSTPTTGTSISSTRQAIVPINAIRRAIATGSIETTSNTGNDTPTQASCHHR